MDVALKENKMGTMKIPRLLFSISVPIIISMVVQALYNIVDSVFVAGFDNQAGTAALTMAFPIQNLILSASVGMAVGINALLSRSLGQKNYGKVNIIAGQGFFLMSAAYLIFLVFGMFFVKPFVAIQAEEGSLAFEYAVQYISIVSIGSISIFIQVLAERLLQSTGKSVLSMVTQLSGAITNIILDPIMIFGWLGFPKMGVMGAAIATVIGQCVSAIIGIFFNLKYNTEIKIAIKNFIPKLEVIKEILIIAIPAILMQAIGSVMTLCMNVILAGFSQEALNVFGIYFKLQSFVFMPIFGLNNGMVPIVAYNYGAKHKDRVYSVMRLALFVAIGYMLLGLLTFQLAPSVLLGFFQATAETLAIGSVAFRVISLSFVFAGFSIVSISVCQALGKSIYSLFVSIGRQLVVLIPSAFLLSLLGDVKYVWWAFPIAEIVSVALCVVFLIIVLRGAFGKGYSEENEAAVEKINE